ncbi:MAG TPA: hypothetical protein PLX89_24710, partial [Verrucomicrobiota bacterium]|nr:hypothetical protein [Verrucomicrobiales bacterium]HRI16211.1 hypothetical protein [Verrucomicrobiota bacterium]
PVVRTPPLEIVRVEEPPPFQVARDSTPLAEPIPPTNSTSPPVREVVMAASSSTRSTPAAMPETADPRSAPRRTFWQKLNPATWGNPVSWFRGSDKSSGDASTNSPSSRTPPPITQPTVLPPRTTPLPTEPIPTSSPPAPKPVVARYRRPEPLVLTPGDRAAAEAVANQRTSDRLASWQRAVQLDPSWAVAWQQLGRLALESGRTGLALQAGEAAATLEPDTAAAHQLFAAALVKAGYPADAAEQLERAVALAPGSAAAHLALAGLYARELGEPALARPQYEKVLQLDPQHPQAGAIRLWLANNP